ncbi:MFS transporter [Streptomyces olivoreticuli]
MGTQLAPTMRRPRTLVAALVFLGMAVAVVSSLGAPLIPRIAAADHVSLSDAQWSLTITLLVGAVATPTMGRLGDGPRRRAVILGAAAVMLAGSVLAALPLGFGSLIAGRALQGVGAGLTPLAIATARDCLPPDRSRPAVALLSITTVAGAGLGYPLTGLIAQSLGLHAAFWFGAAVSAAALAGAAYALPPTRHLTPHPLDVLGAVLFGAALAGLLLVLGEGGAWGWTSPRLLGLTAASLAALAWWTVHELRTAHPLVDLRLVKDRTVLTADVTILIAGIGMYLLMSLVTRFAQTPATAGYGFGASVAVTGLILLPFSAASIASSKVVPVLTRHTSTRLVLPLGCAVALVSMLSFAFAHSGLWELFLAMGIAGLGVGCTFAVIPGLVVGSVPARETGSAISFNQVLRCVGYSTGSALSATVLQAHTSAGHTLPSGDGYLIAALIGCAIWATAMMVAIVLPRRRGVVTDTRTRDEEPMVEESSRDAAAAEAGALAPRPVPGDRSAR